MPKQSPLNNARAKQEPKTIFSSSHTSQEQKAIQNNTFMIPKIAQNVKYSEDNLFDTLDHHLKTDYFVLGIIIYIFEQGF